MNTLQAIALPDVFLSVTLFEAQLLLGTGLMNVNANLFLEVGHGQASPVQKIFNKLHFMTFIFVPRDQKDIDRCRTINVTARNMVCIFYPSSLSFIFLFFVLFDFILFYFILYGNFELSWHLHSS